MQSDSEATLRSACDYLCLASSQSWAFAGVLFLEGGAIDGSYALAALTSLLWALWMLAFAYGFAEEAPIVDPAASIWKRLGSRLKLGFLWILAVAMAGLMVVAVIMTFRTIGILLDA